MDFTCRRYDVADCAVIVVAGELDMYTAPELRQAIVGAVAEGRHRLVLDISELTFCDSTGLAVLVSGLHRVRRVDGSLRLVDPTDNVMKVLRLTRLDLVFPVHDGVDQALAADMPRRDAP